ncbi:NADPH:quinone oxidoreductase family protein [Oceanicella actignis]|uniref:NADPH:quinone oxidoreductase family protein n=1 Tax=Oceanicella actignis TaxID=1189325 RepID=UPI0011E7E77B|nr:NADPH:quinone oxidoreductase family protein [Oceanicella actignis]TYO89584.1 NADPH2:quinone reductase [Oceanicella actignis]
MRAMRIHEPGARLRLDDVPAPEPGPGQVRIRVAACGVNFADTLMTQGKYQLRPEPPFAPGGEVCGVVEALGPGVERPALGARVAAACGWGGFAEAVLAPAAACVEVPDAIPSDEAAAFLVAYGTSHMALDWKAGLQAGETLLVLGAAGGVGLTAVEVGKLMGARVIACASGPKKLALARSRGADHLIDSSAEDIREATLALGGADVVYDPVGGEQFRAAMRACRPDGRLLPIGFASGEVPQIPANILLVKNLTVIGFWWGAYPKLRPERVARSARQLIAWRLEGRLRPHVSDRLPLEQANEALDLLRTRRAMGKVVLIP